jgi:hypothetical protein
MRVALLVPILAIAAGQAIALDSNSISGGGVTLDYIGYGSQKFNAGYFRSSWSDSQRYEINCMMTMQQYYRTPQRVVPCGGVYGYFEDRDWRSSSSSATGSYYSWGLGLQGGANVYLLPPSGRTDLSLVPYLRGGIGYQNASFSSVPYYGYPGSGSVPVNMSSDSARVEFQAGIDARLVVAQSLEVVFGVGVDYYSAANIYISGGTNGGSVGAVGNSYAFNGTDAWLRFGAGVHF